MNTQRVRPWEVEPGDVVLGTGMRVSGHRYAGTGDIGSDRERQRYAVVIEDGREIVYNGEGWLTVIREAS